MMRRKRLTFDPNARFRETASVAEHLNIVGRSVMIAIAARFVCRRVDRLPFPPLFPSGKLTA
jgi:hypothetical protein